MDLGSLVKRYYRTILVVLGIAVLYRQILADLAADWWNDPNSSHGLVLPFVVAWLIWRRRAEISSAPSAPSNFGLLVIIGALAVLFAGELGAELFLTRISLLILLAGLVLFFFGWKHLRMVAFPAGLLLLAIPLPAIIFYQITFPLQVVASKLGSLLLESARVPTLREGNVIVLPNITLEVAEACSGIRSLFTLATLTIVYGYLLEDAIWLRLVLIAFTIPLALFCNGLRIMGTGILAQYVTPEAAEGFFHIFSGWFIFVVALITLLGIHKCMVWTKKTVQVKNGTTEGTLISTESRLEVAGYARSDSHSDR